MKKLLTVIMAIVLSLCINVDTEAKGKDNEVVVPESNMIFEEEITVGPKGGKFEIEFIEIQFLNGWLDDDELPITFTVKLYAEDGDVYVEITPDVDEFFKDVIFRTKGYSGYIYDVATGENIYVEIPHQHFKVEHFSRYCWGI